MNEAAHTPTPWDRRNNGILGAASARHEIFSGKRVVCCMKGLQQEDYDNAAFIIKACNNHDALVEALEGLMWRFEETPGDPVETGELDIRLARAALAKAKE